MHTHKEEEEAITLNLYCRLFVRRGPWFALDYLYGRHEGGVGRGRSDADADANADDEGEAREGGDVGKYK